MSVLVVDWLGRGGIAQCTWAWADVARRAGIDVTIVTRPERELRPAPGIEVVTAGTAPTPVLAHLQLVRAVVGAIEERRPSTVVLQNFVIAPVEVPVARAARRAGARVVHVVHDHRLHTRAAGTSLGLARSLRRADLVVAHTPFVAERVAAATGASEVRVVPLPLPVGMFDPDEVVADPPGPPFTAIHFGVLHRGYKGTSVFNDLAGRGVDGWCFRSIGAGAEAAPGVAATAGFVSGAELVDAVDRAAATVLPYQLASQSAAVVVSQARRTVPVVTAVGGIPDQVDDGVDGILVDVGAPLDAWVSALEQLADVGAWRRLADAGRRRVRADHERFTCDVEELLR